MSPIGTPTPIPSSLRLRNPFDFVDTDTFPDETWEDLRVPLTAIQKGGVNDPDFAKLADDGAGSTGVFAHLFDAAAEEEVFFSTQLPHYWDAGSDLYLHLHAAAVNANAGDVVFGVELTWSNVGDPIPNTTIYTVTLAADNNHHIVPVAQLDGTGKERSSMICGRVFRDATNVADTYASDVAILEVDLHYRVKFTDVDV